VEPTEEQAAILQGVAMTGDNIQVRSFAGTGKTTMLRMIDSVLPPGPVIYLAFSRDVVKEMEEGQKNGTGFRTTTTPRTLNSLGHRVWAKTVSSITLDTKKTSTLFRECLEDRPKDYQTEAWDVYSEVSTAVGMAKALGYIPEGKFTHVRPLCDQDTLVSRLDEQPSDLVLELLDDVLTLSIKAAYKGFIDYNDQVYMPAVFGGTFPQYPTVLIDEEQDLNPVNHRMLDKLAKGRLIGCGDPFQSIYGFRGAVQSGMEKLKEKFSMTEYDLSVSFRCPRAIVENARWRVPHYKWIKEGGLVSQLPRLDGSDIPEYAAVICRNNAPLFRLAFDLISHGRSVSVAGSDIGPKLIATLKRLGDDDLPRSSVLTEIDLWLESKLRKGSITANDMAEAMRVFAGYGETLGQAISYAEYLFEQQGAIKLLTGHKSKGLEFDTVYFLDPQLIKNDTEQELNLRYVIQTRAKDKLYEINSADIIWSD